jgi:hypothetical protein
VAQIIGNEIMVEDSHASDVESKAQLRFTCS